ncbi:MAG: glycosyltransferase [Promethearchaeota archaeon]
MNSKNTVALLAIGKNEAWSFCKRSIEHYCKKYNLNFLIINQSKFNITADDYRYIIFEKFQLYDLLENHEKILLLDADTLITPQCPNIFDLVPNKKLGVVFEDKDIHVESRKNEMKIIQKEFDDVNWTSGYFNAGIILVSYLQKDLFFLAKEDIQKIINSETRLKAQTFLNYKAYKLNIQIFPLNYKFNHMPMFSEVWNDYSHRFNSYIIHYAGLPAHERNIMMRRDFLILFKKRYILLKHLMILFNPFLKKNLKTLLMRSNFFFKIYDFLMKKYPLFSSRYYWSLRKYYNLKNALKSD